MHLSGLLVAVTILIALSFDFINGFHDAANSIATVVSTRVLSPRLAVIWAAFFNFIAAFVFGTAVAKTIAGGLVDPHHHPTHEFYYVTAGRGLMTIGDETREIAQGDLVHIPPDAVHSLRPVSDHAPIHCFCFAVAVAGAGEIDYTSH